MTPRNNGSFRDLELRIFALERTDKELRESMEELQRQVRKTRTSVVRMQRDDKIAQGVARKLREQGLTRWTTGGRLVMIATVSCVIITTGVTIWETFFR